MTEVSKTAFTARSLTKCAILSAVAVILMLFDFPLPIAPSFYKVDFSEVAVLIGAFSMGPAAGVIIEALKIILNLLLTGSNTAFVGELANFLIGIAFVVPASVIYCRHRTKKNAMIGMAVGTVAMALAGSIVNYFVLLPMYSVLYGMPMDAIIDMGRVLIPFISSRFTFVCFAVIPFNLIKGAAVSVLTALLYKRCSVLLRR